jgi:predicted nucleic acid-binding protein
MVDASPLIYLAKLDALDVFAQVGHVPLITPEVERESARPGLAYRFPDALTIAEAIRDGILVRTELTEEERRIAARLGAEAGGLDAGESEVLAAAEARELPVLLHERRAIRLARSLGLDTWSPLRLLMEGTAELDLLRERVLRFARLVQMRFEDVEALIQRIEGTAR